MQSVRDAGHDITGKNITVMGVGGASMAICAQSALDGAASVHIFPAAPADTGIAHRNSLRISQCSMIIIVEEADLTTCFSREILSEFLCAIPVSAGAAGKNMYGSRTSRYWNRTQKFGMVRLKPRMPQVFNPATAAGRVSSFPSLRLILPLTSPSLR